MKKIDEDLTMHKLLGEHAYTEQYNEQTFDKEFVCKICGYIKESEQNLHAKRISDMMRLGDIDVDEAMERIFNADEKSK